MAASALEKRVASLENELAQLKSKVGDPKPAANWLESIYGAFANDPVYDEAMRLGREYRESLTPKPIPKQGAKKANGNTRHRHHNAAGKSK